MKKDKEAVKANKRYKFHFDNVYMENPQLNDEIILYQIGDLSCEGGYVIGEHEQFCYEISYVMSGKGDFYTNGRMYPIKKGDVYISLPGELHNGIADHVEPFRYFYVGFNFKENLSEQNPFYHMHKMLHQARTPILQDKWNIHVPFMGFFSELINMNDYSSAMIKLYLHQIIILAYRNFFAGWETAYSPKNELENSKQIVYDIINYIDNNMERLRDLSYLADELGYSYTYLSRTFSAEVGLSIQDYYNKKRFEKAVRLLKESSLNITQVAEALQYQSIHSFSKAFRKNFGISPTEYQMMLKSTK